MSIEAMRQALEALDGLSEPYDVLKAQNALRAAIEQSEKQEPETELETYKRLYELRGKALERPCSNCGHQPAKIKAMAQPEQEPVAFDHGIGIDRFKVVRGAFWWHVLIGDSPTEHGKFRSRVSAEKMAADLLREFRNGAFVQHTTPRQWQGLTDEEIIEFFQTHVDTGSLISFASGAEYAEAKLREKNHG